ncbi:hypothetical protein [Streptomyces bluensis]|uniref:hypothetical protein n=1 Tax=Streptomyces bluensis TaxID=33897 RepID=UPI001063EC12|nr:hypothetical protein [Streptomyces bluensis]GGZ80720.1 hypothetical protein GCM10010344_54700 [Streptomyces bluensis]
MAVSVSVPGRKKKAIIFGTVAAAFLVAIATAGGYWLYERKQPSQASKADCELAQRIVDGAQDLSHDKEAVEEWEKNTMQLRRSQMKDGYLGFRIAQYEVWAALQAKGEGTPPTNKQVRELADKANSHCADAGVTLTLPPIAS